MPGPGVAETYLVVVVAMPRSDPTRSDYCATRHLLRQLKSPRRLRLNPLVRDVFDDRSVDAALREVCARVERALDVLERRPAPGGEPHGARHAAILLRVDIRRHRPSRVAADLGLSIRQFHRERRVALARFLDAYRAPGTASVQTLHAQGELSRQVLTRAASLADSGEPLSARALFDDIAANAEPADRARALIELAGIDAWAHRFDVARARLRDADTLAAHGGIALECRAELRDASDAVALALRWFSDGPSAVALQPCAGPRATLVRAAAALRSGEAHVAARLLHRVGETIADAPAQTTVDALTLQGELADFNAGDPQASEALFARAAALARANALGGRELYAAHQLALTRWMHSRSVFDRRAYRQLVDRVDRSLSTRLRSYLAFSAADIELAIGHPGRALRLSESAEAVSTNAYESLSARGLAAGALLRLGRIDDAVAYAGTTTEAARTSGHPRIVSLAQRISAQALLLKGNRRAARAAIEESIELARHFASVHALATARAVLARIRS